MIKKVTAERLRGRFISLEGVDGSGTTTQAGRLAGRLRAAGLEVLHTREPGGSPLAEQIRRLLLRDHAYAAGAGPAALEEVLQPQTELLLFLAARKQHLHATLLPALAAGQVVVCDRFHDSTIAYQQHGRGLNVALLNPWLEQEILQPGTPQLTFWLDVSLETARARRLQRLGNTLPLDEETLPRGEDAAFLQRVSAGYAALHKNNPQRIIRIDGEAPADRVAEVLWQTLLARF